MTEYEEEIKKLAAWFKDQWENHRDELPVFGVDAEIWDRMMEDVPEDPDSLFY